MAAPVVKNTTQVALAGALNLTSPADTAVGDLVICFCWAQGTVVPSMTTNNGISAIRKQQDSDGTTSGNLSIGCRVASVAGAQTYQAFVPTNGTAGQICGGIITVTGADTYALQPESWLQNGVTDTTATAPNPPSVTPLTGDYLVLTGAAWHVTTAAATSATVMANYTLRLNGPTGTHVTHVAAASREMTGLSAATEDPATWVDNVTPNGSAAITFAVPAATGTPPSDLFNRADTNNSIGGNWTNLDNAWSITGNMAEPFNVAWSSAYWTGTVLSNDHYSEITIGTFSGGSAMGPMVRMKTDFSYYYLYIDPAGFIYLQKIVAGAAAVTLATITQACVVGDVVRLEVQGSTLRSYYNTVLKDTSTDTAIPTSSYAGFFAFPVGAVGNSKINAWAGGDVAAAAAAYPHHHYATLMAA